MRFKEGVKRKEGLCFVGKGNRKESDKTLYVSVREKVSFWEKREKKPREELGRENPFIFAVESLN